MQTAVPGFGSGPPFVSVPEQRIRERYGESMTAQTPDAGPMGFTRSDFWYGAWNAWLAFMLLLTIVLGVVTFADMPSEWGSGFTLLFAVLLYGWPIGGIVAALVLLLFSPLAWGLARALRTVTRLPVHVVAYTGFGALVGAAVLGIYGAVAGLWWDDVTYVTGTVPATIVMTAIAVPVGWWRAARRTLRVEQARADRVDPDAAYEDAL